MEATCEFCGGIATVYCPADWARLCLPCDRHIHSANVLAQRHLRTLLCHACNTRPAAMQCPSCHSSLCQACDLENHDDDDESALGISEAVAHKRHSLECFTGCPSATELAALWACEYGIGATTSGPGPPPLPIKVNQSTRSRKPTWPNGMSPNGVKGSVFYSWVPLQWIPTLR